MKDTGGIGVLPSLFPMCKPAGIGFAAKSRDLGVVMSGLFKIRITAAAIQTDGAAVRLPASSMKAVGPSAV